MRTWLAVGLWFVGAAVCTPALAHRGDTVECRSRGYQYTECAAEFRSPVLQEQLSDSECIENRTWGYKERRGAIWVTQGCAAVFTEGDDNEDRDTRRHRDHDSNYDDRSAHEDRRDERRHRQREVIECRSSGYALTRCEASWSEARLVEQLSDARCVEGRSWGLDEDGLWVDQGCAGRFEGR